MNEQPNPDASKLEALQNARKQITRSLLLATAALGVIAFACYAWFVNNTSVTARSISVSASGSTFELASVGSSHGAFDESLPDDLKAEEGDPYQNSSGTGTITTVSKNAIFWQMNDAAGLNNQNANDTGIEPGSSGTLQFYVIPKHTGKLNLTCQLSLIPLKLEKNDSFIKLENVTASQFLKGHLLFSYTYTDKNNDPNTQLVNYSTASFPLEFEVQNVDDPISVQLDWHWPLLLQDVINDKSNSNTYKTWMTEAPGFFFCDNGAAVNDSPDFQTQFSTYNDYFNNADQYIGDNVDGVLLQLTAVEG